MSLYSTTLQVPLREKSSALQMLPIPSPCPLGSLFHFQGCQLPVCFHSSKSQQLHFLPKRCPQAITSCFASSCAEQVMTANFPKCGLPKIMMGGWGYKYHSSLVEMMLVVIFIISSALCRTDPKTPSVGLSLTFSISQHPLPHFSWVLQINLFS